MDYIYETHLHTREASACGKTPGRDYISFMKGLGYSGIIVTDHFYFGNTAVSRELPWPEWVDGYCRGFEEALEASRDPATANGLSVFFGVEYYFEEDEYLLYGIDKAWLKAHHDMLTWSRRRMHEEVRAAGGIMIQAHPYRERAYNHVIRIAPDCCDGAELYNAANEPYQNALAKAYIEEEGLRKSSGSDIHVIHEGRLGGLAFDHKLESIRDFADSFMAGEARPVIRLEDGTFIPAESLEEEFIVTREPELPVYRMETDS